MSWFSIVAAGFLTAPVSAQVAQLAAPPDALTARPIEPMVAPVQRVKPAVPKLDPRLSGQPQTPGSVGGTATVRAKYLASKAAKPKANVQAAPAAKAAGTAPLTTKGASGPGKAAPSLPAPPVAAKAPPKPAVSQAPVNPPANIAR